ncbi:class A beta-lactamase-related serine hydrolase, partial [Mesorhizobium sp. M00.F.Ca.ET.186.01.1.1]
LDFSPGERFLYASINYDVLGLVVEEVTGKSFEQVAKDNVLTPLGMQHSYLFRQEAEQHEMAKGYKIGFLGAREYEAPVYRGNTPAGYIISNSEDMAIWLKKQLGSGASEQVSSELIRRSHQPDRSVFPGGDGSSYAAGWFVYQKGSGELSHGGSNPNYSSSVVIRPGEQLGVAVLTNINSAHTQAMGQGIMEILQGKQPPENVSDLYSSVDKVAVVILCIAIPLIAVTAWFAAKALGEIARKQRRPSAGFVKNAYRFAVLLVCLGLCGYCFWQIPSVLFDGLSWSFVDVWAPASFVNAILSLFVGIVLFSVYYWMTVVFPKANDRTFFPIIVLSTVSGLGNALIIFIINEALNHTDRFQGGLFSFFFICILLYF